MADSELPDPILIDLATVSKQTIELYDRFGTLFEVSLASIDYYRIYGITSVIVYASQIGACFAVLVVLVMLTKAEKRKSPVFLLNSSALLFNTIGAIMQCLYFTGDWFSPYAYLSGDYFDMSRQAKNISIAPGAFACLVVIALEASLVLQLNVVCITLKPFQRLLTILVSILVALIAIGFRIAQVTTNVSCNIERNLRCDQYLWIYKTMAISTTISICFFSCVFCAKLGWSLFQRRKMGLTQFGPMQIIFIGAFQTMIIPAIFAILQFATNLPEINSNVLTVTAISLPLSSLWASGSITKSSAGVRGPDAHRKFIVDSTSANSTRNKSIGEAWGAAGGPSGSRVMNEKGRIGVLTSITSDSTVTDTPMSGKFPGDALVGKDLEMQQLEDRR